MQKIALKKIEIYQFNSLSKHRSINHFITTKNPNYSNSFSLSLSSVENTEPIIKNRELLAKELNIPVTNFAFQQQEHTSNVTVVENNLSGKSFYKHSDGFPDNDAMITAEKNICLMIMGADCVPIMFYDPVKKVIGAAHAGWRGTVKNIASETVKRMQQEFGCLLSDILAGIGPSIGPDNYEVDEPVYNAFKKQFEYADELFRKTENQGKYYLDLWSANLMQLIASGLEKEHIEISGICTFENNSSFFSARKGDLGRFAAGIMMM